MTTGEKIAALRREKGLTQDGLAEILKVSRQSVSKWEMDLSFPETEKLIRLSKVLSCSLDFLLNNEIDKRNQQEARLSVDQGFAFIRDCSYFFLATSVNNQPKLRPFGFIYSDGKSLYISTDKRKEVYKELLNNPFVELASYNLNTGKWIRISGKIYLDNSQDVKQAMMKLYPMIKQEYTSEKEVYLAIFRLDIDNLSIK